MRRSASISKDGYNSRIKPLYVYLTGGAALLLLCVSAFLFMQLSSLKTLLDEPIAIHGTYRFSDHTDDELIVDVGIDNKVAWQISDKNGKVAQSGYLEAVADALDAYNAYSSEGTLVGTIGFRYSTKDVKVSGLFVSTGTNSDPRYFEQTANVPVYQNGTSAN